MININHYKEKLLNEKESLGKELETIAIFNTETDTWEAVPDNEMIGEIDDNDIADRFEDFEERSSMVSALQKKLTSIDRALGKMDKGTYGLCEVCGKPIETERLEANPAARADKEHLNDL